MSSNTDQVQNICTSNEEKDAALVLEEEVSTQKSESLVIRIPSSSLSTNDDELKHAEKQSRKRNKEQLNILKRYFGEDPFWSPETYKKAAKESGIEYIQAYKWGYHQRIKNNVPFQKRSGKEDKDLNKVVKDMIRLYEEELVSKEIVDDEINHSCLPQICLLDTIETLDINKLVESIF